MNPEQICSHIEERTAELLNLLNIEATIQVDLLDIEGKHYIDVKIQMEGEASELIGHAGTRLKALSTVLNMMLPRMEERYAILLDINGYRDQRMEYIKQRTIEAIDEALSTSQPVAMQPMSSWERRIVHVTAGDRTDIATESEGEEGERYVIIKPVSVV